MGRSGVTALDADATMQLVSDWLTKYGKDLKGICASDDSAQALHIFQALGKAGRAACVVVAGFYPPQW